MQMSQLSSKKFLAGLMLIFFGAVGLDISWTTLGFDQETGRILLYLISAPLLVLLLYIRLNQMNQNRIWAVLGIIQPLGIAFGLYLYVSGPRFRERGVKDS